MATESQPPVCRVLLAEKAEKSGVTGLYGLGRNSRGQPRIECKHHPHIFMFHIVAVEYEGTFECSEPHQHLDFAVAIKDVQVAFETIVQCRLPAIVTDDLVRFEMNVNWMPPAATAIAADPAFHCSERGRGISQLWVVELLVDLPCTIASMEFERASYYSLGGQNWMMRSQRSSHSYRSVVRLSLALNDKFQERDRDVKSSWAVQ